MGRAEIRRAQKSKEKQKTITYNLTKEQLDCMVQECVKNKIKEAKEEAMLEAANMALALLLTLPLEVLMDYYWTKSYEKRIPEFTNHVLDYYEMWQDGKLDMKKLQDDLWKYGGVRLEGGVE